MLTNLYKPSKKMLLPTKKKGREKRSLQKLFSELGTLLLQKYMRRKITLLNDTTTRGILFSGINWRQAEKVTSVSTYVMDFLVQLVCVHNEMFCSYASTPELNVISALIENSLFSMVDVVKAIEVINEEGLVQLETDFRFIQKIVSKYLTSASSILLTTFQKELRETKTRADDDTAPRIENILRKAEVRSKTTFRCFA
eukprot:TRINITY_DN4633_c0_g3_i2.p1 TRINITY_DN4633_c0_g3~~TRINITY_DN4633_c0_g3_i2.p1  ORF type:complete len:198 (-),score=36.80 TRINITY_DN4633_c0_g3_i2:250-843(-)